MSLYYLRISESNEELYYDNELLNTLPLLGLTQGYFELFNINNNFGFDNKKSSGEQFYSINFNEFRNALYNYFETYFKSYIQGFTVFHDDIISAEVGHDTVNMIRDDYIRNPSNYLLQKLLDYELLKKAVLTWLKPSKGKTTNELFIKNSKQKEEISINQLYLENITRKYMQFFEKATDKEITFLEIQRDVLEYLEYFLFRKTTSIGLSKIVSNGKCYDVYTTENASSLIWVEILWAINNNRFFKICPICNKPFTAIQIFSKKTCSNDCKNKYIRESHSGGPEGYKKYKREQKRKERSKEKKSIKT